MQRQQQSADQPAGKNSNRNSNQSVNNKQLTPEEIEEQEEDAIPDDPDPILDEADLEENGLSVEDADDIQWEADDASVPQAQSQSRANSGGARGQQQAGSKKDVGKEAAQQGAGNYMTKEDIPESTNEPTGVPGSGQRQDTN